MGYELRAGQLFAAAPYGIIREIVLKCDFTRVIAIESKASFSLVSPGSGFHRPRFHLNLVNTQGIVFRAVLDDVYVTGTVFIVSSYTSRET